MDSWNQKKDLDDRRIEPENPDIAYAEGTIVCDYLPYAWIISPEYVTKYCYRCGLNPQPAKVMRCAGCHYAHYCSKECQAVDWKDRHKVECKIFSHKIITSMDNSQRGTIIMLFSAIARVVRDMEEGIKDIPFLRLPVDVNVVLKRFGDPMVYFSFFKELFQVCDPRKLFIKDGQPGVRNFAYIHAAMKQSYQPLIGEVIVIPPATRCRNENVGTKLDVPPVPIMKSCLSNVLPCCGESQVGVGIAPAIVVAMRDIKKGEPLAANTEIRFATLRNRVAHTASCGTICSCKACTDPIFQAEQCAMKCANAECTEPIPYDGRAKQPCPACGTNNSHRFTEVKAVMDKMSKWLDLPEEQPQGVPGIGMVSTKLMPDPAVARQQITQAIEVLHPTNLALGKAMLDYCHYTKTLKQEDRPEYIAWLKRIIPSIELHLNKFDQMTRFVYFDIVQAYVKRKEFQEALPYIDTVLQRLKVIYPETHKCVELASQMAEELRKTRPSAGKLLRLLGGNEYIRAPKSYKQI